MTTLYDAALDVLETADPLAKADLGYAAAKAWFKGAMAVGPAGLGRAIPNRPARLDRPILLSPRDMPKRSPGSKAGRIAYIHSLAHIELSAVDLTFDLIARFCGRTMPRGFFDDWVQVGLEEAKHFRLLANRLRDLDAAYGDLPAHDGLWQAAEETGDDLTARLAIVPLVLEARGLDIQPSLIKKARRAGDEETAAILDIIYRDEKKHVAFGVRWFRHLCAAEGRAPEPAFHDLVRRYFRRPLRPPFNDRARSEAGLTPGFYRPLATVIS
ncbi:MAG: ferritin-like domain-containing protein [Pseudomonadota bacterium]